MWIVKHTFTRTLIWLVALAIPWQGLTSPSCACGSNLTRGIERQSKSCCCSAGQLREGSCCCSKSAQAASKSCCQSKAACCSDKTKPEGTCKCGATCRCHQAPVRPPAAPPVENHDQTEKVSAHSLSPLERARRPDPPMKPHRGIPHLAACVDSSLGRCVSLCRFLL